MQLKKIPFVIRKVPDRYKTQATIENDKTLQFVRDQYKTQKMCDKAVDNYAHALEFAPDYYKTQKMCNKTVNTNTYLSTIIFVPECYKTQEIIYDKAVDACFSCILFCY